LFEKGAIRPNYPPEGVVFFVKWNALGKGRTRFGRWIDQRRISQHELAERSGVGRNVISRLANEEMKRPSWRTEKKVIRALREYDSDVSGEEFWG